MEGGGGDVRGGDDSVDYDESYHQERDRQALELGAKGDPRSISTLQRIVARDTDPRKRQKAAAALSAIEADDSESGPL